MKKNQQQQQQQQTNCVFISTPLSPEFNFFLPKLNHRSIFVFCNQVFLNENLF